MAQNTFEVHVGRLVEVRIVKGFETVEDVVHMNQLARKQRSQLPADFRAITVADWRQCGLMSPEAAEQCVQMLTSANVGTERSALLYSERSPLAVMQFLRIIRDSNNPNRRMFSDPRALLRWMEQVMTEEESLRLREFLGLGARARAK